MKKHRVVRLGVSAFVAGCLLTAAGAVAAPQTGLNETFARDAKQPIDQEYSAQIKKYTTAPNFLSHLVDYLPASRTVPTPKAVLGDVAGAPDMLPYAEDVYRYFRMLETASPRVKVYSIGKSEEGREMIAAAIADPALLKGMKENDERLAKLSDPRKIGLDDKEAQKLIDASYPVYYITGTIHSPETGAPTALMEMAYRLAVDESPYIQYIRSHMVVLITPVVEVDGRDRQVDVYKWHKAHPDQDWPRLLYWGHYVAHDNNRDAMGMTLNLTNNVLNTYLQFHAQVLHDLHESVALLYDNTVGDGPYNAWIDPILADEWAELGWNNVAQMQSFGMPGVFTHGDFDTWSPGYLMFLAAMHNGISRLYETFGNGGADTLKRKLDPEEYSRTWYRQNPPPPVVTWSQRDNNNYEESALLSTLAYFSRNTHHFLENYYTKSKRSVEKPQLEGPAAYVLPAKPEDLNRQVQLLNILKLQHVEVAQLSEAATVSIPASKKSEAGKGEAGKSEAGKGEAGKEAKATSQTFPAGSFVVRLDQPYSRVADALLDKQYWAPDDPQKHPYDDTGWSFSELFNTSVVRVTDGSILKAKMSPVEDAAKLAGKVTGSGPVYAIANTGQTTLLSLLYAVKGAKFEVAEKAFEAEGKKFPAGSLLIADADGAAMSEALKKLSLDAVKIAEPDVAKHAAVAPRVAFMHTWLSTQAEGWWRQAFDKQGVPFTYMNTQTVAADADLRSKYDVIVFAPMGGASAANILNGMPMWHNALPWENTELTPNLGTPDETKDMRPGLGYEGLEHLKDFVAKGGLLITCEDTAQFAIDTGLAAGVSSGSGEGARVVGTVLNSVFVSPASPIAYGYSGNLGVMSAEGMVFSVSNILGQRGRRMLMDAYEHRPTGRGGPDENDNVQGRVATEIEAEPKPKTWEAKPVSEEQKRNNPQVIPEELRPEVILRFGDTKGLLLSGLLDKAGSIAEHAIVVNAHYGQGNVLLFANNPLYRGETIGSYGLVFNAILNFDHLRQPVVAAPKQ